MRPFKFSGDGRGEIVVEVHRRGEGKMVVLGEVPEFCVHKTFGDGMRRAVA